ncbi:hypothetical protein [Tsuneonella deserti]|nr:hypothetical protein [Tsuneonella deserti]
MIKRREEARSQPGALLGEGPQTAEIFARCVDSLNGVIDRERAGG